MTTLRNISRRDFLNGAVAGGLTLGAFAITGCGRFGGSDAGGRWPHPDLIIRLAADGTVTIVATRSEMGQGVRTSLPMIVADELEADWARVTVEQAVGHPRYGDQNTDASASVRKLFQPMREAGAAMRQMLKTAAARTWDADESECEAAGHRVVHTPTGRTLDYGELAAAAGELPVPENLTLKTRDQFRYIGKPMPGVDASSIARGAAVYGIDATVPGMRYAAVRRCPVIGGRVASFDDAAARAVSGVRAVVAIGGAPLPAGFNALAGVAVVADNTWAAMQGRDALEVEWDDGPNAAFDSEASASALRAAAQAPGRVVRDEGNVDGRFDRPGRVVEATYEVPLLVHAPMEPPACVASVTADGCEVWAPVQAPQRTRDEIARVLGIEPDTVVVNVTLLGGAFGRKAKPDFVLEAVEISRAVGAPVRVTWSREDDVRHGYYHANSAQYFKAVLNDSGAPEAWLQRSVFPPIDSTFDSAATQASASELRLGFVDNPYRVPNLRCENGEAETGVRIGWLRSVCNLFHAFAVNSFADELAAEAGEDPLAYRLRLLGAPRRMVPDDPQNNYGLPYDTGRLIGVLEAAADAAQWGKPLPSGRGQGLAIHRTLMTYVAQVVEASVDESGAVTVHRVDCAVDCGLVVNPNTVVAQMEGAIVFALSAALHGQITVSNGRVNESNFHDYEVVRMDAAPEIHVHLVDSDEIPTGAGEPGVPPLAPALCGAIYAATGKRIRRLPIGDQAAAEHMAP